MLSAQQKLHSVCLQLYCREDQLLIIHLSNQSAIFHLILVQVLPSLLKKSSLQIYSISQSAIFKDIIEPLEEKVNKLSPGTVKSFFKFSHQLMRAYFVFKAHQINIECQGTNKNAVFQDLKKIVMSVTTKGMRNNLNYNQLNFLKCYILILICSKAPDEDSKSIFLSFHQIFRLPMKFFRKLFKTYSFHIYENKEVQQQLKQKIKLLKNHPELKESMQLVALMSGLQSNLTGDQFYEKCVKQNIIIKLDSYSTKDWLCFVSRKIQKLRVKTPQGSYQYYQIANLRRFHQQFQQKWRKIGQNSSVQQFQLLHHPQIYKQFINQINNQQKIIQIEVHQVDKKKGNLIKSTQKLGKINKIRQNIYKKRNLSTKQNKIRLQVQNQQKKPAIVLDDSMLTVYSSEEQNQIQEQSKIGKQLLMYLLWRLDGQKSLKSKTAQQILKMSQKQIMSMFSQMKVLKKSQKYDKFLIKKVNRSISYQKALRIDHFYHIKVLYQILKSKSITFMIQKVVQVKYKKSFY